MSDIKSSPAERVDAVQAAKRMEQSLALVATFTEIWMSNPFLAKQAGRRVREFVMTRDDVQKLHAHDLD